MSKLCPNCGAKLREGTAFCTRCGAATDSTSCQSSPDVASETLRQESPAQPRQTPPTPPQQTAPHAAAPAPAAPRQPRKGHGRGALVAVVAIVAAILVAAIALSLGNNDEKQVDAHRLQDVILPVSITNFEDTGSSGIPVHVIGTDSEGGSVDTHGFVASGLFHSTPRGAGDDLVHYPQMTAAPDGTSVF